MIAALLLLLACDGDGCEPGPRFLDLDGDGHGGSAAQLCDNEGVTEGGDCDDGDPSVHPGADEQCDALDQDCDGAVDEGLEIVGYLDMDADGYGTGELIGSCAPPDPLAEQPGDCDDADPDRNPGAEEICGDGLDSDCVPSPECGPYGAMGPADAAETLEMAITAVHSDGSTWLGEASYGDAFSPSGRVLRLGEATSWSPTSGEGAGRALSGDGERLLVGGEDRSWILPDEQELDAPGAAVLLADLTGDGQLDALMAEVEIALADDLGAPERWLLLPEVRALMLADPDGDGLDSLFVGVPLEGDGGEVHEYALPLDHSTPTARLESPQSEAWLGTTLDRADFDGDGVDELVIGLPFFEEDVATSGTIQVRAGLDEAPYLELRGGDFYDRVGSAVAIGDVDQDGVPDLLFAGCTPYDECGPGRAWWVSAPGSGVLTTDDAQGSWEGATGDGLGLHLTLAPDRDADGWPELLVAGSAEVWLFTGGGE